MLKLSFIQSLVLVVDVIDSDEFHRMGLLQRVLEFSQEPGHLEHQPILTFLRYGIFCWVALKRVRPFFISFT